MKKSALKTAIVAALGVSAVAITSVASAGVMSANWTGYFTMLDSKGAAMGNTSAAKGVNQYVTQVSGTMQFDTVTGAGTATLVPFNFFSNAPSAPAQAVGINMQAIGNGAGGAGTLVLANMLFNWNGTNGIPVSLVMDAAGFFANEFTSGGANSATPASDGTYIGLSQPGGYTNAGGYLHQGKMPMVTTAYNTSNGAGCTLGSCLNVSPSGVLPIVVDTAPNSNDYATVGSQAPVNTGGTIGGNPMQAGPFQGSNANFNIGAISVTGFNASATIAPNCNFDPSGNLCAPSQVPVPAAAWLFGSGLLGLVGVARRRKA
jgi:hypothetical protein